MFAFNGEFEHNLDDKGRVIVPVRFRDALADGYFITRGLDGCLWLFPMVTWQGFSEKLTQSRITQHDARQLDRLLFSGTDGELDKQGRLNIPSSLRSHAGLDLGGPVVVLGVKNRIELWEPARWADITGQVAEDSHFAEQLGELGL
jgi:MraZ protein